MAIGICVAFTVVFGVVPGPILNFAHQVVVAMGGPMRTASANEVPDSISVPASAGTVTGVGALTADHVVEVVATACWPGMLVVEGTKRARVVPPSAGMTRAAGYTMLNRNK